MKCLILLPVLATAVVTEVASPVQKVVTMLKAMSQKGEAELQEEKVQYAKYAQWCQSTKAEKSAAVDEATEKIEVLKADISKAETDADVLAKDIDEHSAQIERIGKEKAEAVQVEAGTASEAVEPLKATEVPSLQVRQKEAEDYAVELKEQAEKRHSCGQYNLVLDDWLALIRQKTV
eukprot:Skav207388  [mRNA]  locus=scaffold2421:23360:27338:+ [translate_table: standard]